MNIRFKTLISLILINFCCIFQQASASDVCGVWYEGRYSKINGQQCMWLNCTDNRHTGHNKPYSDCLCECIGVGTYHVYLHNGSIGYY